MPHHHMVIPHYMGRSKEIDIDGKKGKVNRKEIDRQDSFSSVSRLQDIPLLLPQEAGVVTSNEDPNLNGSIMNNNVIDHTDFSENVPLPSQKLEHETLVSNTQMKGFQDEVVPFNMGAQSVLDDLNDWWDTPEKGTNDATSVEYGQVGPQTTCQCQVSYALLDIVCVMKFFKLAPILQ